MNTILSTQSSFVRTFTRNLAFLSLALSATARAQTWTPLAPQPTARNLNSVALTSPTRAFIVGAAQTMFETQDAGATWSRINLQTLGTDQYYSVVFPDAAHGYVFGNNDDAWRTIDGGTTWTRMTNFPPGSPRVADFLTPTTGFVGLNGAIVTTTDGGNNWQVRSGYPNCPIVYGMDFRNAQTGLIAGYQLSSNNYGTFRTTNGGQTWTLVNEGMFNDVLFLANGNALAAGNDGAVFRSFDDGQTWTQIATGDPEGPGILDFTAIDLETIVAVSGKGDVLRSADSGYSWALMFDGLGDLPGNWAVSFADAQNGLVVGVHGIVLKTGDAGINWQLVSNGIGPQITDIKMFDSQLGLTTAQNGYVQRTVDGGATWALQKLEVTGQIFGRDESLNAVSMVDRNFAVAAGPGGTVFRTLNGGLTWESTGFPALPNALWIEDVKMIDHNTGWLVGLDQDLGHAKAVYRTTDGAATWQLAFEQNSYFISIDFADAFHGWIATIGNLVNRTTDGGQTWQYVTLPGGAVGAHPSCIRFANSDVGWVVGWYGYVARTMNGGQTWQLQSLDDPTLNLLDLCVVSPNEAWAVGRNDSLPAYQVKVCHTTNGGMTWTSQFVNEWPNSLSRVSALSSGEVWLAGYDGRILSNRAPIGLPGDMDGDGDLDAIDTTIFIGVLLGQNTTPQQIAAADMNGDGAADGCDVPGFIQARIGG